MDWSNLLYPYVPAFKRFCFDLLKERYADHEPAIEKLSALAINEKEYKNLASLLLKTWEAGYFRAVEEQKNELRRLGLKVNVNSKNQDGNSK